MVSIDRQIEKIKDSRMEMYKYNTKKFLVAKEQVETLLKSICVSVMERNGLVSTETDLLALFSFVQLRTDFEFDLINILLDLRMWEQMIKLAHEQKDSFLYSSAISKRIVIAAFVNELGNYYLEYMSKEQNKNLVFA